MLKRLLLTVMLVLVVLPGVAFAHHSAPKCEKAFYGSDNACYSSSYPRLEQGPGDNGFNDAKSVTSFGLKVVKIFQPAPVKAVITGYQLLAKVFKW